MVAGDGRRVLIAGGYGVFGSLLARELSARTTVRLVIAGRDGRAAAELCRHLGAPNRCEPMALDLSDREAFRAAVSGCFAVLCAAGPFQGLDRELPRMAVAAGAHWLDLSDDEQWVVSLLSDETASAAARSASMTILPGLSSVPGLSGALVRWCRERAGRGQRARIVLWIGNRNRKGAGAIASALRSGFGDPVTVRLPTGICRAYRFRSPDEELLRKEMGIEAEFRVAFEWGLASRIVARLQKGGNGKRSGILDRLPAWLAYLSAPLSHFGSRAGCLQTELFDRDGRTLAVASFSGEGQRLAIVPAAIALDSLLSGERRERGCVSPATWLGPGEWVRRAEARGIAFSGRMAE